jgi:hypothetical protein
MQRNATNFWIPMQSRDDNTTEGRLPMNARKIVTGLMVATALVSVGSFRASADGQSHAQPQPQSSTPLVVIDATGAEVGRFGGYIGSISYLIRWEPDGNPYSLEMYDGGLAINAEFWYTTPNCTGQKYSLYYSSAQAVPPNAQFDGTYIWTADQNYQFIHPQSREYDWDWNNFGLAAQPCMQDTNEGYAALVSNPIKLETVPQKGGVSLWAPQCTPSHLVQPGTNDPIDEPVCKQVLTLSRHLDAENSR